MLYSPTGSVVSSGTTRADRQEEQAEAIRAKLKALDSLLDIVYVEWAQRYSLICNWPQGDSRWPMFQSGEIGASYDSLGWFCQDMSDPMSLPISLDDVESKVMELLSSCDNERRTWKTRMADHIDHNRKIRKDRQKIALDQVEDVAATLHHAAGHLDDHALERLIEEVSGGKS